MEKQKADILIANAAADVMNQRIFSKVKSSLIGLYGDREDFYKRVQFDYDGHARRYVQYCFRIMMIILSAK